MYSYLYDTKEAIGLNNTSEKLIHISAKNFSEKGYYGTSLNNIANNLGVKKASLYNYIKSKDELYGICLEKCMEKGLTLIGNIDTQSENLYEELLSFFQKYIYDSDYLVKFYIQLSFVPSNFTKVIEEYNNKLASVFNEKLREIHAHNNVKLGQDDFVSFINMFIHGWLYRTAFMQSKITKEEVINEFEHFIQLLMHKIT